MNILIIGSGGRENAIAWKFSQNEKVEKIYCVPGNAGTAALEKAENIDLKEIDDIVAFCKENSVELTMVGSEEMLVEGIVDKFEANGLKIFGPNKKAAILEGSKAFSKDFMKKYGVKTAAYENFTEYEKANKYLDECPYPTVIKASGLAAGKGVVICQNKEEAKAALEDMMLNEKFNEAGKEVVIEEFLEGVEASILSITDSKTIIPFISAKDHKKIGEGDTGLNTGGMGVVAPNPYVTEEVFSRFQTEVLEPTLKGLNQEGMEFCGIIFFGLMINEKGVYSLEYNMRMGDPETQVVLPLMESDFLEVIEAAMEGKLSEVQMKWKEGAGCCVVAASGGYPEAYDKGYEISGCESVEDLVFMAGVKNQDSKLLTNGGRVLNVVALADDLEAARKKAYSSIEKISFEKMYYRRDIGEMK